MRNKFFKTFLRFRKDEKGVTLVEYGIALVLAVAVGGLALTTLGNAVSGKMDSATSTLNNN